MQVRSNYRTNAVKNTESGRIEVGQEVHNKDIYFYVKDTGIGIPQNHLEKGCDRFTKLDARKKGTGLGLSISQTIIKKLGGDIGVISEVGVGSTFWFTLPVRPSGVLHSEVLDETNSDLLIEATTTSGAIKKILIAEDSDENFLMCQAYLEKKYILFLAYDGDEDLT